MTWDQIDELIRKYLAMGVAVVVVLTGAGGGGTSGSASPTVITIDPRAPSTSTGTPDTGAPRTRTPRTGTGAPRTSTPDGGYGTGGSGSGSGSGGSGPDYGDTGNGGTGGSGSGDSRSRGTGSAAAKFGWGTPNRTEDFTSGLDGWNAYDGAGHDGKGRRSPAAATAANGVLTITGSPDGTTAGLSWGKGQKYGRWEARVRSPAGDPSYHPVMLLWPDAENWPAGGEVDFMEISDPDRQKVDFFLHHGADNSQEHGTVEIDATQWHDWAVEWTPQGITAYVDGRQWYRITDPAALPPGPMHLTIQLDWFPKGGAVKETTMQVAWVRQYSAP